MTNLNELMARRNEINFEMIEAEKAELGELQAELQDIENEIEVGTGKKIEELDKEFYGDDHAEA